MATFPPSRAKVSAISLPMPLAAPVTMQTFSFRRTPAPIAIAALSSKRIALLPVEQRSSARLLYIVVHDVAETEREIGENVGCRLDLQHRQLGDGCQGVRGQRQGCGAGPYSLQNDVLEMIFDELADARGAVDVRNNLQQEIRCLKQSHGMRQVGSAVLKPHCAGRNPKRSVIEGADKRVDFCSQRWVREL